MVTSSFSFTKVFIDFYAYYMTLILKFVLNNYTYLISNYDVE